MTSLLPNDVPFGQMTYLAKCRPSGPNDALLVNDVPLGQMVTVLWAK